MPRVLNETKGTVVAERVGVARSFWSRFRGLMLRGSLPDDTGLLIEPGGSIHTAFMRFPIDAVFLDRQFEVVKVAAEVKPWRTTLSSGHSVLELPSGKAAEARIEKGDRLLLEDGEQANNTAGPGRSENTGGEA